jgi:hypothetical protein
MQHKETCSAQGILIAALPSAAVPGANQGDLNQGPVENATAAAVRIGASVNATDNISTDELHALPTHTK